MQENEQLARKNGRGTTITLTVPNHVDPAYVRFLMACILVSEHGISLEEAAQTAELTLTEFQAKYEQQGTM